MSEREYKVGDKVMWGERICRVVAVNDDKGAYVRPPYQITFDFEAFGESAKGLTSVFARDIAPIDKD